MRDLRYIATYVVAAAALLNTLALRAEGLSGRVIKVADGDTLTILADTSGRQERIRLEGIDAPERKQAFSQRAKQQLAQLTFNERVVVDWKKRDRYGRVVGKVTVRGVDVNLRMVAAGLAWHYKKYELEQTDLDRKRYADAERLARSMQIGLWVDANPIPPWEFRARGRALR